MPIKTKTVKEPKIHENSVAYRLQFSNFICAGVHPGIIELVLFYTLSETVLLNPKWLTQIYSLLPVFWLTKFWLSFLWTKSLEHADNLLDTLTTLWSRSREMGFHSVPRASASPLYQHQQGLLLCSDPCRQQNLPPQNVLFGKRIL